MVWYDGVIKVQRLTNDMSLDRALDWLFIDMKSIMINNASSYLERI